VSITKIVLLYGRQGLRLYIVDSRGMELILIQMVMVSLANLKRNKS
jgi:hypothetical protein